ALQLGLTLWGIPGWQCPMFAATGIPCPGCGLTRATVALLRCEWRTSLTLHAFAPILALTLLLLIGGLLPVKPRQQLIDLVEAFEQKTRLTGIVAVGLILYWLARLLFFRESFIRLIAG
ncbi:MAG TPA: DUF2752 domain-containing protein, partial [Blastocatellia bacterium]|nr:DUF2752 domain-containing protein [Blastocatellia bacterium]